MKLYLSSYRIPVPDALFSLLPKPALECTVAIIPNAKDYKLPAERAQSLDELIVDLGGLGFKSDVVDLREYEEAETLRETLEAYPVMFAAGGNAFMLRSEMKRTGFDNMLPQLLEVGAVYIGESAGAIVAGSTLRGAEIGDDPGLAEELVTDGVNLIDRVLIPHADSVEYTEYINHMKQAYAGDTRAVYLDDNQAFVVHGDHQQIVTAG